MLTSRRDIYPGCSSVGCSLALGGVELLLGLPCSALLMNVRFRCRRKLLSDFGSPCGTARVDVGDLSGLDADITGSLRSLAPNFLSGGWREKLAAMAARVAVAVDVLLLIAAILLEAARAAVRSDRCVVL